MIHFLAKLGACILSAVVLSGIALFGRYIGLSDGDILCIFGGALSVYMANTLLRKD